ncbi:MAG: sulfite exporter TauE/SafE family protein [Oceanospirillaceae bacterium]|nr:sulfite exporter TauE/SafE family protein [Oceanospirillaceae bacterium]
MEITILEALLLLVAGLLGGIINTLAGGGSNLTMPALMVMGLPADVANATNRLGVFLQALTGTVKFNQKDLLPKDDLKAILIPSLIGGLIGAIAASWAPLWLLKPMLLGTMLCVAGGMLIWPNMIPDDNSGALKVSKSRWGFWGLLVAGIYGGFVQAGVGFVLLAVLAGGLRYDLVRANALKLLCTIGFTLVALLVFIAHDLVNWYYGIILSVGFIGGALIGVKLAIKASAKTMRRAMFGLTLVACVAVYI